MKPNLILKSNTMLMGCLIHELQSLSLASRLKIIEEIISVPVHSNYENELLAMIRSTKSNLVLEHTETLYTKTA